MGRGSWLVLVYLVSGMIRHLNAQKAQETISCTFVHFFVATFSSEPLQPNNAHALQPPLKRFPKLRARGDY